MKIPVRPVLLTGSLLLIAAIVAVIVRTNGASAGTSPTDWTSSPPSITKIADLATPPAETNLECSNTSVQVYRSATSTQTESYCMVPAAMGLSDVNGRVVQPNGYTRAYPLEAYNTGGNPVIIPIRNQAAALEMRGYSAGVGVSYQMYKHAYSHAQLQFAYNGPKFKLIDPPEEQFRYGDNRVIQFNPFTLTTSNNGRYFIVDTIFNGFMKVDLLNLGRQPIAISLPRDSSGGVMRAATAIDNSGKFAAIAYGAPGGWGTPYFKIINVGACTGSFNSNSSVPPAFSCPTIDVRPKLEQMFPGFFEVRNVRFVNDRTITFVASTRSASGVRSYASYSLVAGGQDRSLVSYLALGDSYISGEGAFSYRQGTDTERNRCHQSTLSYPYLLSSAVNSFASVACSGAKTQHVIEAGEEDTFQVYGGDPTAEELTLSIAEHRPGYNPQSEFVREDNPDAITISLGGNDIGFSDILTKCVHPFQNLSENWATDHTCYPLYEDRLELVHMINGRLPKLRALYESLRNSGDQPRRVYVIGYPQVAKVGGDCGLNVQMNASEVKLAHDLIEYLDRIIKQAADEAGVVYVDTQAAFEGSRLCEGDGSQSSMNGFTISRPPWGGIGITESFHPNKKGHEQLAQVIAAQTSSLTRPMPEPAPISSAPMPNPDMELLKNAPASHRVVYNVYMLEHGDTIVHKGSPLDVIINGQNYYTKPNTNYNAVLRSDPINLGTFTSDAKGNLSITAAVPAGTEPGFHTLHIYGEDIFGNPIDLQRTMYVAAGADDYDSDGVSNDNDSCVLTAQSDIDRDVDGIDDVCDPLVGPEPVQPPEPEGIVWRDDAVLSIDIQSAPVSGE